MSALSLLTVEEVLTLHDDVTRIAGGESGLRSLELLQSAIAQPAASFAGQPANTFPFGMAAAYAFHLSRNHPFVDNNQRLGLAAAVVFLFMNGWELVDPDQTLQPIMVAVAQGLLGKPALAWNLERLAKKRSR